MRRGSLALLAAVSATVVLSGAALACSMCQCGDPTYRLLGDNLFGDRAWRLSADFDHLSKDQIAEDFPSGREYESAYVLTAAASWAPLPRLRFVARLPFTSRAITDPAGTETMLGVSDPDLFAHVNLFQRSGGISDWMALMVGVKTGWGQNERTIDGERADEHLQPGSGATSLLTGLSYSIAPNSASHWYASAMARWNGTNAHDYRYGNMVAANLSYQHALMAYATGTAELNVRTSQKDLRSGGADPNTGGTVLYVTPKTSIRLTSTAALKLGVQIPVVQQLFGDQREHVNLQTGITVTY